MSSSRPLRAALIAASVLVVGLAACTGADPAAVPTSPSTPSPTVEAPPEAKPGSRIPVSCDELATVASEFTGVAVAAVDPTIDFLLVGFAECALTATIAGAPVRLTLAIIPEVTDSRVTFLDLSEPYQPSIVGFAGPRSGAACQVYEIDAAFCESVAAAQRYTIVVNMFPEGGPVPADAALSALASLQSSLVQALDAAGEPLPEWDRGEGVLIYPRECETQMAAVDRPIIDALPFDAGSAYYAGSGDGPPIYFEAARRAESSLCEWSGLFESGAYGSANLFVLPGAAFAVDEGIIRPVGEEIAVSGADRAWHFAGDDGTQLVTLVADRSVVRVGYAPDYLGTDPDPYGTVLGIVDAIIATGPRL